VARANEWLRQNAHLRAKTCESIEVKGRYDGVVDTNKSCYYEADHSKRRMRNLYIRALRLKQEWINLHNAELPLSIHQQQQHQEFRLNSSYQYKTSVYWRKTISVELRSVNFFGCPLFAARFCCSVCHACCLVISSEEVWRRNWLTAQQTMLSQSGVYAMAAVLKTANVRVQVFAGVFLYWLLVPSVCA